MTPNRRETQGWKATSPVIIKVNCDVSWCRQTKSGGNDVVARNSDGRLIGEANRKLTCGAAKEMEVEAIFLGIKLAIKKGWDRVEIESDSEVVNNQLRGNLHHWRIETTCSNITTLAENIGSIEWKVI